MSEQLQPRRQTLHELDEHLLMLLESRDALLEEQLNEDSDMSATDDIEKLLSGVEADILRYSEALATKVDGCAGVLRELDALAKIRKQRAKEILAMAEQTQRTHDYLQGVILATMQARGVKRYEGQTSRLTCAGNGGLKPLVITDLGAIPVECKQVSVTLAEDVFIDFRAQFQGRFKLSAEAQPNNAEIRKRLDAGEKIDGAHLADRGVHLIVK